MGNIFDTEKPNVVKTKNVDVDKIIANTNTNNLGRAYRDQQQKEKEKENKVDDIKVVGVGVGILDDAHMATLMQPNIIGNPLGNQNGGNDSSSDIIFIDDGSLFNIINGGNRSEKTLFSMLRNK